MRSLPRFGFIFIFISLLTSCRNEKDNCSETLQKVIKTGICDEILRISTDSNYSENLCKTPTIIDSNFRNDTTFFGYFILDRHNLNCSSDSLKSWRFNARYTDSIYSKDQLKVYEGDLIYSSAQKSSHRYIANNNFNSSSNFICVRQIINQDILEIYYFFRLKKSPIDHKRVMTFGFNN